MNYCVSDLVGQKKIHNIYYLFRNEVIVISYFIRPAELQRRTDDNIGLTEEVDLNPGISSKIPCYIIYL